MYGRDVREKKKGALSLVISFCCCFSDAWKAWIQLKYTVKGLFEN